MLTDELLAKISIQTADSTKEIKALRTELDKLNKEMKESTDAAKQTSRAVSGISATFQAVKTGADQLTFAFKAVKSAAEAVFKPFLDSEDAATKLANTLSIVGTKNIPEAVKGFQDFAKQLQATTVVEDDHAIKLIAIAKATGVSDEATKKLIKTAANIAAVTGEDVDSAFSRLKDTYKGVARGVADLEPQLKNLTEEQLKAGKAVDILADKFDGFAEGELKTFGGKAKQAANIFGDIMEDIGQALFEGFNLKDGGDAFIKTLKQIKDSMEEVKPVIQATASAVKALFTIVADVGIIVIEQFSASVNSMIIGLTKLVSLLPESALEMAGLSKAQLAAFEKGRVDSYTQSLRVSAAAGQDVVDQFTGAADAANDTGDSVDKLSNKIRKVPKIPKLVSDESLKLLEEIGKKVQELFTKRLAAGASELDQIRLAGGAEIENLAALQTKIDRNKELSKLQKEQAKAQLDGARASQGAAIQAQLELVARKSVVDIAKESAELGKQFSQIGMDEQEILQDNLKSNIMILATKREQLSAEKDLNAEAIAGLDAQVEILKELTRKQVVELDIKAMGDIGQAVARGSQGFGAVFNQGVGAFNKVFETDIKGFSDAAIDSFAVGAGAIADALASTLSVAGDFISKLFDPDFIQNFADGLSNFVDKLPDALIKAFNSLINAFQKIVEKLPETVNKLFDAVGGMIDKLLASAPKIIDSLTKALGNFIDRLPEIFQKIFDALPGIFDKLLKSLPGLITKIFSALGDIIAGFIKVIPDLLKSIFDNIPDIVESFITGILDAMGKIVAAFVDWFVSGGVEKIVGAFLRMIPKLVVAIVKGIVNGLAKALGSIFKGFKVPDSITGLPAKIAQGAKDLGKKITQESSQLFKVLDLQAAAHGLDASEKIQDAIDSATTRLGDTFRGIGAALKALWQWVYDHIFQPIFDAIRAVWQWVYDKILSPIINAIKAVWQWVYDSILSPIINALRAVWQWVWDNVGKPLITGLQAVWTWINDSVVKPLVTGLQAVWKWVYDSVISPFLTALSSVWSWVKDTVFGSLTSIVKDSWAAVVDFFSNIFKGKISEAFKGLYDFFDKLKDKVVDAFKSTLDMFGNVGTTIWNGLKKGIDGAGTLFSGLGTGIWNGLKSGLGSFADIIKTALDKINPANILAKVFKIDMGGTGTVEKTLGIDIPFTSFASGGIAPGSALVPGDSALNDRLLALVSPGEAIIPRSKMSIPWIKQLVDSILSGTLKVPGHFLGIGGSSGGIGISNPFGGGGGGLGGALGGIWDGLSDAAKGAYGSAAGAIGAVIDPDQFKSLGDALGAGSVNLKTSPIGDIASAAGATLQQAQEIADKVGRTVSNVGQTTLNASKSLINKTIAGAKDPLKALRQLNPKYLWDLAKEEAFKVVTRAFAANHFHTGGYVGGFAQGGDIPSVLQRGEFVMSRAATSSIGANNLSQMNKTGSASDLRPQVINYEIDVNISFDGMPDENFVRTKVVPQIKKELKAASQKGELLISEKGVFKG